MDGKRRLLECGHQGTAIIGQFYLCDIKDCTGMMKRRCPKCGSERVESFPGLAFGPAYHCWACGRVFGDPVNVSATP